MANLDRVRKQIESNNRILYRHLDDIRTIRSQQIDINRQLDEIMEHKI